ncbi:hypothetical protein RRG08_024396 [Elysia crispata]|uniref:Uncharacterized protein n=1 Tax=Elysia crispata TaxID=231223 RepID=A0AAE0YQR6_9GAST|nr:hypothetical protein RRG08_024396 [Elysia crispata]
MWRVIKLGGVTREVYNTTGVSESTVLNIYLGVVHYVFQIIEATSILDYEDTDVGSIRWSAGNRQSPVGSGQPRSKSPSYTIHKQTVEVQLFERPQSPVPNQTPLINQAEKLPQEADTG